MRFLLLSNDGSGIGLALRLEAEGHEVEVWMKSPEADDFGKGLVKAVGDYRYNPIVIADSTNFGPLMDLLREGGIKTFGGSSFADKLEGDRKYSEEVMTKAGIETPKSFDAPSWEGAAKAVRKVAKISEKIVVKPEGELSGVIPSFIASDEAEALETLESFESQYSVTEPTFVIQEFIEGIAVSTEGWFNGEAWLEGMFNHTLEKKESLNDDLGPTAGCAGNVVWSCDSDDPIVRDSLQKLTDTLREHHYIGAFDINCVVNEKGIYGLEFTPRFGFDAFPTLLYSLCDFSFAYFIDSALRGEGQDFFLREGFGAGVRVTVPKEPKGPHIIEGFSPESLEWFYPVGVQYLDGKLQSAPTPVGRYVESSNMLGVVNGYGSTINKAFSDAYKICSDLRVRGLSYRTDLGRALLKDFQSLEKLELVS
jgi:phosphoribosylamine---glycine ligase